MYQQRKPENCQQKKIGYDFFVRITGDLHSPVEEKNLMRIFITVSPNQKTK